MHEPDHSHLMSIGEAVATLQASHPDISHSSLRFLQREGLIDPRRTPGGHRLYSEEDLDRIRLIKRWQADRLSLVEIRNRLAALDALDAPANLVERFLTLALGGDMAEAARMILLTDDLGMPLVQMFDDVLRPALVEIGQRWAAGTITVAQEHEVSELSRDLIAELSFRHAAPDPGPPAVVAACVEGDRHELGVRMVAGVLRQRGARVHYLGASVEPAFLVDSVTRRDADVVLLGVSLPDYLPALEASVAALHEAGARPTVVAGGQGVLTSPAGVPDGVTVIPPDLSLVEIAGVIERMAPGPAPTPA